MPENPTMSEQEFLSCLEKTLDTMIEQGIETSEALGIPHDILRRQMISVAAQMAAIAKKNTGTEVPHPLQFISAMEKSFMIGVVFARKELAE